MYDTLFGVTLFVYSRFEKVNKVELGLRIYLLKKMVKLSSLNLLILISHEYIIIIMHERSLHERRSTRLMRYS